MENKKIIEILKSKGYDTHFTNGTKTVFQFSKYFDKNHKSLLNISDAYLSIGLEVSFIDCETRFEFNFVTPSPMFRFLSGQYSNVLRDDFDVIERSFELYCSALTRCYNINL